MFLFSLSVVFLIRGESFFPAYVNNIEHGVCRVLINLGRYQVNREKMTTCKPLSSDECQKFPPWGKTVWINRGRELPNI